MKNRLIVNMMQKEITEIATLINEFGEQDVIPQMFVDLTISKVKNLYLELQMLNKSDAELLETETKQTEPLTHIPKNEQVEAPPPPKQKEIKRIEKPKPETLKATTEKTKKKPAPIEETTILAETFRITQPSLNELIGQKNKKRSLATQFENKPISSIKASISLNDKIRFIRDLFAMDKDKYVASIEKLDNFDNLDQALQFLDKYFDFGSNNQALIELLELVYKRYPSFNPEDLV